MTTLRLRPDLEQDLLTLPDVQAASVVTAADGSPLEVHVLARGGKPPKQVVRDVQSLAMVRHDIDLDHRIVSVVQLDESDGVIALRAVDGAQDMAPVSAPRPVIATVEVRTEGRSATVTVRLDVGGEPYVGSATGPSTPSTRPRLVARATLAATDELLGLTAEVEHAGVFTVGPRSVAVCAVLVVANDGEHVVSGSAVVRGDEADAVARCVLDALNRRLTG